MSGISSISTVKNYIEKYQLFPRKKWGQNFLVDGNILSKIADSCGLDTNCYVVEIGPGLGALTRELAACSKGVLSIEIDNRMKEPLEMVLAAYSNTRILFADVLQVDIEAELKRVFNLPEIPLYKVCANIPYNITTPIIFRLLETCPHMVSATLMMQKEVASRIMASPGGKEYGLLTLMTAYYSEIEFLMKVSHNCFYPKPEVDSSVIRLTPIKQKRVQVKDEGRLKGLLRLAFQKRRKTMLNICSEFFRREKNEVVNVMEKLGISPACRPETLTIYEFAVLSDTFGG
ncbi:MAG: 16S rRNA (adenine(1518)-N(6)/adenine(1519)-N(6))-dimethyltransferase RsmA [Syntrophomonas sp.]